jgi:hypothetical protein
MNRGQERCHKSHTEYQKYHLAHCRMCGTAETATGLTLESCFMVSLSLLICQLIGLWSAD